MMFRVLDLLPPSGGLWSRWNRSSMAENGICPTDLCWISVKFLRTSLGYGDKPI
jgi:hypothetical protein